VGCSKKSPGCTISTSEKPGFLLGALSTLSVATVAPVEAAAPTGGLVVKQMNA